MAKEKKSKKSDSKDITTTKASLSLNFNNIVDDIEKTYGLSGSEMGLGEARLSTGNLTLDVILGKGIVPAWYTLFGAEQSAKSTTATTILINALNSNVPILAYWDYEGCVTLDTEIQTPEGIKTFREIVENLNVPEGEFVQIDGLKVKTVGGFVDVDFVFNKGEQLITLVETETSKNLRGYAHPILCLDSEGNLVWKHIEGIREGDMVVTETSLPDSLLENLYCNAETLKFLKQYGLTLERVTKVEKGGKEQVWDITINNESIPLPHSFMANGIVTHNSQSADYLESIMRTNGVDSSIESVFGVKDNHGNWTIPPRVRYYSESVGEKFFDFLAKLERQLPDKKCIKGTWYYVFEDSKKIKEKIKDYDQSYYKKTGLIRIPAPDGDTLQALILVDSYPAMLPEKQDVDDPNSAIGVQARMFSEQLKRVKGKMRAKRIAVVGINQLRDKPMVMFGDPQYETGGNALKLFSDARLKLVSRAIPHPGAKGQFEEEDSVTTDGVDTYRYIHVRAAKNKLSVPNLEGWLRVWVTDGDGVARGFCPVWDTYYYLKITGQIKGSRKKLILKLDGKPEVKNPITWMEFKQLILCDKSVMRKIYERIGIKPILLREFCKKQLHEKNGLDLFFDEKRRLAKKKGEDDE